MELFCTLFSNLMIISTVFWENSFFSNLEITFMKNTEQKKFTCATVVVKASLIKTSSRVTKNEPTKGKCTKNPSNVHPVKWAFLISISLWCMLTKWEEDNGKSGDQILPMIKSCDSIFPFLVTNIWNLLLWMGLNSKQKVLKWRYKICDAFFI